MTTYTTLIILSGLVIFSYLFDLIAGKTKIPSVVLLLMLGIGIRQVVDYFGLKMFDLKLILPTLGTLGLILIVFEGALELRYDSNKNAVIKKAFFSALCILLVSAFAITFIIRYFTGQSFYLSFVNAIPYCVVSSAVAIPSASNLDKGKKEFIIYESSFSDILTVILFNFIVRNQHIDITSFAKLGAELTGIILAAIVSCLLLLYLIGRLTHHIKSFLVIALIILVYSIGQSFHLSALIIVLSLGLFLNNAGGISFTWFRKLFIYPAFQHDIRQLFQLSAESAFLMRTFFFIVFGYTMDIYQFKEPSLLLIGSFILLSIYLVRFLYIRLISKTDLMPELVIVPRGLISVLLYYNLPDNLKIPQVGTGLLFIIVLSTSIILSLGLLMTRRRAESISPPNAGTSI
ncbi:MAG TPA: cation:proton antiporter [Mucilaginibacter sp.]